MKRKIAAVIAVILICCAVYLLVPYTPIPNEEEISQVQVLCVYIGDTAVDITDKVDTDAVRELLPQVRARAFPIDGMECGNRVNTDTRFRCSMGERSCASI